MYVFHCRFANMSMMAKERWLQGAEQKKKQNQQFLHEELKGHAKAITRRIIEWLETTDLWDGHAADTLKKNNDYIKKHFTILDEADSQLK